jgi:hypothetical protein
MLSILILAVLIAARGQILLPISGGSAVAAVPKTIPLTCFLSGSGAGASTCSNSGSTNFTAGEGILVVMVTNSSSTVTITSVTACTGDSAVQDSKSPVQTTHGFVAAYFIASTAGGCHSVTVNQSTSVAFYVGVFEIGPSATADTSGGTSGDSMVPSGGALTLGASDEVVVSVFGTLSTTGTITLPTNFTSLDTGTTRAIAYLNTPGGGSFSSCAYGIADSVNWVAWCGAYK